MSVARELLGCTIWRRIGRKMLSAKIVETEAYLGANDPASHARRGLRSERNRSMYLQGGHAYVYFTYGMHFCMNVVTAEEDIAEAVLIRAAEPLTGLEQIRANRPRVRRDVDLLNGPGKLCMGLGIDRSLDGQSLAGSQLYLTARTEAISERSIAVSPRIGIDGSGQAAGWPLRFFLAENPNVSLFRKSAVLSR